MVCAAATLLYTRRAFGSHGGHPLYKRRAFGMRFDEALAQIRGPLVQRGLSASADWGIVRVSSSLAPQQSAQLVKRVSSLFGAYPTILPSAFGCHPPLHKEGFWYARLPPSFTQGGLLARMAATLLYTRRAFGSHGGHPLYTRRAFGSRGGHPLYTRKAFGSCETTHG